MYVEPHDTLPLVLAAQSRDSAACLTLIERYTPLIRDLVGHFPYAEREDAYQETVCEFISLLYDFNVSLGSFGLFIKTKLSWRILNYRRRLFQHYRSVLRVEPSQPGPDGDAIAIRQAVSCLPPRQRHVLVRTYWDDLHADVIAEELGISGRAVRGLRVRAEEGVRQILLDPSELPKALGSDTLLSSDLPESLLSSDLPESLLSIRFATCRSVG